MGESFLQGDWGKAAIQGSKKPPDKISTRTESNRPGLNLGLNLSVVSCVSLDETLTLSDQVP